MTKILTATALAVTMLVGAAQAAPRSAENDATLVAVVAIYINTCDTALSAHNETIFEKIKAAHSYTDNQAADAIVHNQTILAKVGKRTWCDATTKMLQGK